jgi:hypothetical protein
MRAIRAVDHFSASLDRYHEHEVARSEVFAALHEIAGLGPQISLHLTGSGDDDGYLQGLIRDVREEFGDRVPMLIGRVRPTGRAKGWVPDQHEDNRADPCDFAAWPLVDFDGKVYACSRQSLARASQAPHLVLGHASHDSWQELCARSRTSSLLRAIRTIGPIAVAGGCSTGVCTTCVTLSSAQRPGEARGLTLEPVVAGLMAAQRPRDLARRWGAGGHADLVELGWRQCAG